MKYILGTGQKAFTLVELIVVIGILGALATIAAPMFTQYRNKAKSGASASEIRTIEKAVIAYALDKGNLPATLADAGISQLDPWQKPYTYTVPGTLQYSITGDLFNSDFDIYSNGADGLSNINSSAPHSQDDIVRTNNGGFCGSRAGL